MSSEKLIRNIGRYRLHDFIINYDIKYRVGRGKFKWVGSLFRAKMFG